jgi:hypothetical protein
VKKCKLTFIAADTSGFDDLDEQSLAVQGADPQRLRGCGEAWNLIMQGIFLPTV